MGLTMNLCLEGPIEGMTRTAVIPNRLGVLYHGVMRIGLPVWKGVGLRRPEYTGSNRCLPCTAINFLLTGLIGGLIALRSRPVAALFVFLALASIAFRGYLIPGTPRLTKRYLPDWVLAWFGKHPQRRTADGSVDVVDVLTRAAILEPDGTD